MLTCELVQERLAEEGREALQSDPKLSRHVEGCADCTAVLAGLEEIDAALESLPREDAPNELVCTTLEAVERAAARDRGPRMGFGRRELIAGALAASVVVVASLGVMRTQEPFRSYMVADRERSSFETKELSEVVGQAAPMSVTEPSAPSSGLVDGPADEADDAAGFYDEGRRGNADKNKKAANRLVDTEELRRELEEFGSLSSSSDEDALFAARPDYEDEAFRWEEEERNLPSEADLIGRLERGAGLGDRKASSLRTKSEERASELGIVGGKASKDDRQRAGAGNEVMEKPFARDALEGSRSDTIGADPSSGQSRLSEIQEEAQSPVPPQGSAPDAEAMQPETLDNLRAAQDITATLRKQDAAKVMNAQVAPIAAQAFLQRIESLENLVFQPATGYWANTYIPGDPEIRLLAARLRAWERGVVGPDRELERAAHQVDQPFDAPQGTGLAVYLQADKSAVEGSSRLRLQVGLKGAEQKAAHRPAMNVALVLHVPSAVERTDLSARIRALVGALDRARWPGDRFSLVLAGPGGGLLVAPEQFRHGPLAVALERVLDGGWDGQAETLALDAAIALAHDTVRQAKQPDDVLGTGLVLLATDSPLSGDISALERSVHRNAVGGVPLSVVSLDAGADLAQIDRLVAVGQGNRRILERPEEAEALVDRELHAASRAVARAVRLRIRLAPGVKLIDVLGSRRLDEPQAGRVREAEQAIDRRLAEDFGVIADRGLDEEGIQIVIPTFHAGDAHVVLLDLAVDGTGPVADVQVRYKDLTRLKNGVEQAHFSLERGIASRGPLERNVLKNHAAWELARDVRHAAQMLASGEIDAARTILAERRDLIAGLRQEIEGWSQDAELLADEAMLTDYLAALVQGTHHRMLAESLRYAAYRKLQTVAR
jgi:Ca-activated chloride channel family protein